jgi:hypothetical protein
MLTILRNKVTHIGEFIGKFMLMSEQMSIIGWYILRVRMIFASDRTTCGGMRVMTCVLYFFSVTLLLIWISRDQYHQSWSVVSHMSHEVISLLSRFKKFYFHYVFLIRNNTSCNQFNFLNIYRVYGL